jgi:hypothetical protein
MHLEKMIARRLGRKKPGPKKKSEVNEVQLGMVYPELDGTGTAGTQQLLGRTAE